MPRPDAAASWLAATIPGVLEDDPPTVGASSSAKPWFAVLLGRPRGLPVEILTRLVTPGSFLAGAEPASAAARACCCLFRIVPATLALRCLAADGAGGAASAKPWFASAPGAGGTLLLLDLGHEDAGRGGAGPTEACRTVVAMLESRTVVATDAAREGYRTVGATLPSRTVATLPALDGFLTVAATLASRTVATLPALEGFLTVAGTLASRTVATLPALEGFLTVSARLGSLGAPLDLERADAGRAASAGAGFLSIDLPLLGMGAALAGGGRGGDGAKGADAAAAAGCARGAPGPVGGAAGTGT